ncbi:hypothetical protein THITH_09835 [Thioalkalivibrio paradoxus ARh 1]|uniref:Uncharacterized protein n=1 Tax=Thioalkalivibrio paradoxus ARh 1 TaxID=713585 RepID=W0DNT2_9GAMM|nr:hypothetical protein THITH_09835 [Thioalkalivibrio paradoxus ARh 1]
MEGLPGIPVRIGSHQEKRRPIAIAVHPECRVVTLQVQLPYWIIHSDSYVSISLQNQCIGLCMDRVRKGECCEKRSDAGSRKCNRTPLNEGSFVFH